MRYFNIDEFDSPDIKGSGRNMDTTFLSMLDEARGIAKIPFKINSGYRTLKHNTKIHGVANSSHLKGLAVDIHCVNSRNRWIIVNALQNVGIRRIGIGNTFIHADIDTSKAQNLIWLY